MSGARLITIGPAALDDGAGRLVARALLSEGMPVASRQVVDEDAGAIEAALGAAVATPGLVVVLDSPGGSSGEVVRRALARLTGARLALSDKLLAMLEEDFSRRGQAMPRRLDRLGLLPMGAEIWPVVEGAPGWMIETTEAAVAVLPLGSASLGPLVEERVRPLAHRRLKGEVSLLRTLLTTGLSPADAEDRLSAWLGKEGPVTVSTTIVDGDVWVRLSARGTSRQAVESLLASAERDLRDALGEDCYGCDGDALAAVVGELLVERRLAVSVAESCTGGLLGHRLTAAPGSSRYFERGVIAYSNQAKEELLGVPAPLLGAHGAVSAPVAEAMATGICRVGGSPCGLAVTGFAGPDGGSPAKPVGTVFVACAAPRPTGGGPEVAVRHFRFAGGRDVIQRQSAQAALDMLRRALLRGSPARR